MSDSLKTPPPARSKLHLPQALRNFSLQEGRYRVCFAQTAGEVDAALRLRFDVFNLELGEGLDSSFMTMRDRDEFDEQCHHLLVIERDNNRVIATYRMQTLEMAAAGNGFYSQGEFRLDQFPRQVLENAVEVGRACISKPHRNGRVLFLLWKGIAHYMISFQKRYLFGCCSLTSQDPREGKQTMHYLRSKNLLHNDFRVDPQPGFECYHSKVPATPEKGITLPRLFRIYLGYHAKVCSPPAIDRLFKTIDFLVLLDLRDLDNRTRKMFF